MIAPVTIYVPVPTGASGRAGAANRFAAPGIAGSRAVAQPGAREATDPVEEIARVAGESGRHKRMSGFEAALADREARSAASRRRLQTAEEDESRPPAKADTTDTDADTNTAAAGNAAGPQQADRALAVEAAGEPAPLAPQPLLSSLSAPLQGPDRSLAIDALYRMIESFAADQAPRGAIFDFSA